MVIIWQLYVGWIYVGWIYVGWIYAIMFDLFYWGVTRTSYN